MRGDRLLREPGPRLTISAGLALIAVLGSPMLSSAQERSSEEIARELDATRQESDRVERELGTVRSEVRAAEEELATIGARLDDARARLRAAEGQVALGERALSEARADARIAADRHERAESLLETTEAILEQEEATLVDQIVRTFKYGTVGAQRGAMVLEVLRRAEDPNDFAVGMKQLETVVDDQDGIVERVFDLRERRGAQADAAAEARSDSLQAAADAKQTLEALEQLREQAAGVAEEVAEQEQAQTELLRELRVTEDETEAVLQRVAARQAELEADLAAERERERERERRREAERRAAAAASGGGGGGPMIAGMTCPVQGAVAGRDFIDDWGYPRSGGRSHQGNDIFAARGTPVVAVADGEIIRWDPPSSPTGLGGITVTYRTGDGSEWYNAHLDTLADGIRPGVAVSAGQKVGTVGNSGNARTTPAHLHIQRRHAGAWVNPWPTTSQVC